MAQIQLVPICNIHKNDLNIFNQNEDEEQVEVLANSIRQSGLAQPLVVYLDHENYYVLLSGHKRMEALSLAGITGMSNVPCVIKSKPKNELEEREELLKHNIARKKPEEISMQASEANNIWNIMDSNVRKAYTARYKKEFIEKYGNNPEDIDNNFRPRLDYIRELTGLTVSNRTVSTIIKKCVEKTDEAFPTQKKAEKEITLKDIINKVNSLKGIISMYKSSDTDVEYLLNDLSDTLENVVTELTC